MIEDFPPKKAKKIWLADVVLAVVVIGLASLSVGIYAGARIAEKKGTAPIDRREIQTRVYSVCDHEFGTARTEAAYIKTHNKCMAIARVAAELRN